MGSLNALSYYRYREGYYRSFSSDTHLGYHTLPNQGITPWSQNLHPLNISTQFLVCLYMMTNTKWPKQISTMVFVYKGIIEFHPLKILLKLQAVYCNQTPKYSPWLDIVRCSIQTCHNKYCSGICLISNYYCIYGCNILQHNEIYYCNQCNLLLCQGLNIIEAFLHYLLSI